MFKFFTISFKSDLVKDFQSLFFKTYLLSYSFKTDTNSNKHVSNNFKKNYQFFKNTTSPSILDYLVNYSIFRIFIGNLGDKLDSSLSKNLEC
jgi:hypothetical protein